MRQATESGQPSASESGQPSASALDVTLSAEPSERREWVRIVPQNVNVSLSWQGEESRVSYFAELNDISGGGAAILIDVEPPARQPLWLKLNSHEHHMEPIEAVLVGFSRHDSGKILARLKFNSPLASLGSDPLPRERRSQVRFPAREKRALVYWHDRGREWFASAEIVNISGGGAAIQTWEDLPQDRPIQLRLRNEHVQTGQVEARALGTYSDSLKAHITRLEFTEPCPVNLYDLAVFGLIEPASHTCAGPTV